MARKGTAVAANQQPKALVELARELLRREHFHARRCQFDGQRNSIKPTANLRDVGHITIRQPEPVIRQQRTIDEETRGAVA